MIGSTSNIVVYTVTTNSTEAQPIPYRFDDDSWLQVFYFDVNTLEEQQLAIGTDYRIEDNESPEAEDANLYLKASFLASIGDAVGKIVIVRLAPGLQLTDLPYNTRLPSEQLERSLDQLAMANIDRTISNRTIVFPYSDPDEISRTIPDYVTRQNSVLGFDDVGNLVTVSIPILTDAASLQAAVAAAEDAADEAEDSKDAAQYAQGLAEVAAAESAASALAFENLDPRKIAGMIAGYNIANTTRTADKVDTWIDISGNGRTAVTGSVKSTVYGSGDEEFAALGDACTVAAGIPYDSSSLTLVTIYKGGRIPYQYRGEFSTLAIKDTTAEIGVLAFAGAMQFYNPLVAAGAVFESAGGNCLVHRFGAGERSNFCNGLRWDVEANASEVDSFGKIWGGFTGAFDWQFERLAVYFYNRALSNDEIAAIQSYHQVPTATSAFFPVGDSFTVGYSAGTTDQGYVRLVEAATGMPLVGLATKQSITTALVISDLLPGMVTAVEQLQLKGIAPVMLLDVGKNDIANNVAIATTHANLLQIAQECRAAGAVVGICTMPPRDQGFSGVSAATYETRRLAENVSIRNDSAEFDFIVDIALDSRIGDVADLATAYYADGIHPTALGHAVYAELALAQINAL